VHFSKPLDAKHKKLRSDLEVVLNNVILANEMIDAHDPSEPVEDNPVIMDVINSIKGMEKKLVDLITKVRHEEMMNFCLLLNDDVQKTVGRYKQLKRGRKPAGFARQCFTEEEAKSPEITIPQRQQRSPEVSIQPVAAEPSPTKQNLFEVFESDP